jgi:hypothetical protein
MSVVNFVRDRIESVEVAHADSYEGFVCQRDMDI